MTIPMTVVDTIFKALEHACPERTIAAHYADLALVMPHGFNPHTGRYFWCQVGHPGGGWGAKSDQDGMNATVCLNDGDTHNAPVEAAEAKGPVFFERRALREDSAGPGRFRGGLGVCQQVRMLSPATIYSRMERTICAPWGLHGGKPGQANRISVLRRDGTVQRFPTGKINPMELAEGEGFLVETAGGGGFWDPLERDPESVLADVRSGYVSPEAARSDYGVVIREKGRSFSVDLEATRELRRSARNPKKEQE